MMENNVTVLKKPPINVVVSPVKTRFLSMADYDVNLNKIYQQTKQELKNGDGQ